MENLKRNYFLLVVLLLAIIRGSSYLFIKDVITIYSPFEIVFFRFFFDRNNTYDFLQKEFKKIK